MDKQGKPRVDQMWMCVIVLNNKIDMTEYDTLKWTRKESISEMIKTLSGRPPAYNWQQLRKFGWRCIKVNLSFEI